MPLPTVSAMVSAPPALTPMLAMVPPLPTASTGFAVPSTPGAPPPIVRLNSPLSGGVPRI
ncbi:hypothetical protein RCH10_002028 [Variovorax sp. GrIS 2.14]|uniref:hypothetical protein n=1 Tax=Variovorax sp. GrIS 2.14 TaxID=3071709 RepID=UPI0038F69DEE